MPSKLRLGRLAMVALIGAWLGATGALVWTERGPVAIERIRSGDLVLSQDPVSGELAHKLVLDTTIRPPTAILRTRVAGCDIDATRGHPFWRVGDGWRMAKELPVGDRLHSVDGAATVEGIQEFSEREAYNLLVQDFATYFVEQSRLWVHDNTARQVTAALLPGMVKE